MPSRRIYRELRMKLYKSPLTGRIADISLFIRFVVVLRHSCSAEAQVRSSIEWTEPS